MNIMSFACISYEPAKIASLSSNEQKLSWSRSMKDEVFKEETMIADFNFGEKVASVFDDMLDRSVPFYSEFQRMIAEMARDFAADRTNIYDLGCSTGTTLLNLANVVRNNVNLIGIDYSEE